MTTFAQAYAERWPLVLDLEREAAYSHGTVQIYNEGCRCALCSRAKRNYMRAYRLRVKAHDGRRGVSTPGSAPRRPTSQGV